MQDLGRFCWLLGGVALGVAAMWLYLGGSKPVLASGDRFEDYIICTGPASLNPKGGQTDGVWLLDYRSGKLLGTIIDKNGKIVGWNEVDLVTEFGVQPKQAVHFLMTTGSIAPGQAALYVAETATGKFGVYSMGPRQDGKSGVVIRRHDLVLFRPGGG
ncbi:MAG TPA: hypothetical protein VE988_14650 [Gemmataceae bacterium]|nr:hypothetical protein [Gemmataceae bacterium]